MVSEADQAAIRTHLNRLAGAARAVIDILAGETYHGLSTDAQVAVMNLQRALDGIADEGAHGQPGQE